MTYLAVEKDDVIHERESFFWLSRNISSVRVLSMNEAIKEAERNQFLYIGINANNINYMPMLKILRDVTSDPIFISTTSYTMQEQTEATLNGADLFGQISDSPNDNYTAVMANINRINERAAQRKPTAKILTYGDILLAPTCHQAFIYDEEIRLTKNEMDILHYLMINRGSILSHKQIFRKVFDGEYDEASSDVIYSTLKRLRKKIKEVSAVEYIETVRDVGYRLIAGRNMKHGA